MEARLSKARQRLGLVLRNTGPIFTVADVADVLGIERVDASKILSRWARLRGGSSVFAAGYTPPYLLESSGGDVVFENPWVIVPSLFETAST